MHTVLALPRRDRTFAVTNSPISSSTTASAATNNNLNLNIPMPMSPIEYPRSQRQIGRPPVASRTRTRAAAASTSTSAAASSSVAANNRSTNTLNNAAATTTRTATTTTSGRKKRNQRHSSTPTQNQQHQQHPRQVTIPAVEPISLAAASQKAPWMRCMTRSMRSLLVDEVDPREELHMTIPTNNRGKGPRQEDDDGGDQFISPRRSSMPETRTTSRDVIDYVYPPVAARAAAQMAATAATAGVATLATREESRKPLIPQDDDDDGWGRSRSDLDRKMPARTTTTSTTMKKSEPKQGGRGNSCHKEVPTMPRMMEAMERTTIHDYEDPTMHSDQQQHQHHHQHYSSSHSNASASSHLPLHHFSDEIIAEQEELLSRVSAHNSQAGNPGLKAPPPSTTHNYQHHQRHHSMNSSNSNHSKQNSVVIETNGKGRRKRPPTLSEHFNGMSSSKSIHSQHTIKTCTNSSMASSVHSVGSSTTTSTKVKIHDQNRVYTAINNGTATLLKCVGCRKHMLVTKEANVVYCPACGTLSPVSLAQVPSSRASATRTNGHAASASTHDAVAAAPGSDSPYL